jgi:DNA polymerase V
MGFPSPADDYAKADISLFDLIVQHPTATHFMRAGTNCMAGAGIKIGDLLIIDRSLKPSCGSIVIARIDGAFHVRQLRCKGEKHFLFATDSRVKPIEIDDLDYVIDGVVTYSFRRQLCTAP